LAIAVFSAFTFAQTGCRVGGDGLPEAGDTQTEGDNGKSETGVTQSQEVPFSAETLEEIKERDSKQPSPIPEQKAVPFQEAPPPVELPESEALLPETVPQNLALQETSVFSLAPSLSNNFIGIADDNTRIPPDTMGAAGPSHLVSILNNAVAFFDKSTGTNLSQVSLQSFWSSLGTVPGQPASRPFDPKVIYDQHSGRFIAVTIGYDETVNSSWILIAVSATSDPTGIWYKWGIDADKDGVTQTSNWADFPGLGVDAGYVYITANMFNQSTNSFQYSKVWVIEKSQLLNGTTPITWTEFANPMGSGFTMQPAHVFGASSIQYVVHEGYLISGTPLRRLIKLASITFPGGTPTWTDLGFIEVTSYPNPIFGFPDAPQLGSSKLIETNDTRILNAVFRNGYLWTTHMVANDANTKTEVAWYQIDPASASLSEPYVMPFQQGRISDTDRWYYFPSIAVNANSDVGIGFSGSSTTEYVSGYYTGRQSTDASGTMQSVGLLKAGEAPYFKDFGSGDNRWGDYSATSIDPDDDLTFWTIQEYAGTPSGGSDRWGTWWGKFPSLPAAPGNLSAAAVSASQINLGWTDNSNNETGFKIERKTGSGGAYSEITTVGAEVTTYNDTGLNESTAYFYRVRAFNVDGNSTYSNEASALTFPNAPGNLSAAAVSASQINLGWTDNSGVETGFKIERKTGSGGTYSEIATVGAEVTTYNDTGLNESTAYFYRVRAFIGAVLSIYSNEANATTMTASSGGGGGGGSCSIGARQNTPTALVSIAVMLIPLVFITIMRRKRKYRD
jgi:hypothetical protein